MKVAQELIIQVYKRINVYALYYIHKLMILFSRLPKGCEPDDRPESETRVHVVANSETR